MKIKKAGNAVALRIWSALLALFFVAGQASAVPPV